MFKTSRRRVYVPELYDRGFPHMHKLVPEGTSGEWSVEHFRITPDAATMFNLRNSFQPGRSGNNVAPGTYARLVQRFHPKASGTVVMSDTQMERNSNMEVLREARGRVLIAGLGLGMVVHAIEAKPGVTQVVVVEKEWDVMKLCWDNLRQPVLNRLMQRGKVRVVHGDIFTWRPEKGEKFDTIYFDIWVGQDPEGNLPEIAKLHQAFKYYKAKGGWMDSWYRELLRAQMSEWKREGWA